MEPAPLTAVALVFRSKSKFAGLPHVVSAVSLFLDTLVEVPLRAACKFESVVLLDRIWSYSDAQYQFTKSMMEAVRLRNVEMVHWLASKFPEATVMMKVVAQAASSGSLEILQVFYDRCAEDPGLNVRETLLETGVGSRSTEVVEWVYTHFPPSPWGQSKALEAAVCSGSIAMVERLLDHGVTWWTRNLPTLRSAHFVAEELGSVEMLQWLDKHGQLEGLWGLVIKAAGSGFADAVRWLLDRGVKDGEQGEEFGAEIRFAIHTAASNGHLSLAKYLQSRAYTPADSESRTLQRAQDQQRLETFRNSHDLWSTAMVPCQTMANASKKGFLDVVQWLYTEFADDPDLFDHDRWAHGLSNTRVTDGAAENGHLDVLQYLHEVQLAMTSKKRKRGDTQSRTASIPEFSMNTMDAAAANGHLTIVQWLHNNRSEGCSSGAMASAARNGHFEVVEWLFTNRPQELEERIWMFAMGCAAENGHFEVVKYLHGKKMGSKDVVNHAALGGKLGPAKWLHSSTAKGCTAMDSAARSGNLELVKWLHYNTTVGCTTAAMDQAAHYGHLHVLEWLHLDRTEGCTEKASKYAAEGGNLRVLQWLHSQWPTVCSSKALNSAARFGHFEVVLFLHSHYAAQLIIDPWHHIVDNDLRAWVEGAANFLIFEDLTQ